MVLIDGRSRPKEQVLKDLKAYFERICDQSAELEVLLDSRETAIKVKQFTTMSGRKVQLSNRDGNILMTITGDACRCG